MRVIMLLKSDAQSEAGIPPDERMLTDMGNYSERLLNAGVMLGGEGLQPTSMGAKVRIAKGKTTVIDGPFAEAKEVVAGYYMLRTKDLKEAIEWAKQLPGADYVPEGEAAEAIEWARRCLQIHMDGTGIDTGEIEVRRVYETEEIPVTVAEKAGSSSWREQEKKQRERLGQ
jgi:hypothetical protein